MTHDAAQSKTTSPQQRDEHAASKVSTRERDGEQRHDLPAAGLDAGVSQVGPIVAAAPR